MQTQKTDNTVNLIILGFLTFMTLRLFFIHTGSVILPGGKSYNGSLCRRAYESGRGNTAEFIAIGIDPSIGTHQILTPHNCSLRDHAVGGLWSATPVVQTITFLQRMKGLVRLH